MLLLKTINWRTVRLIICLFPGSVSGQIAIELGKVNVLVAGVENPVTVVSTEVPDSCIALQSAGAKIKKHGTGRYAMYAITTDTSIVTLTIIDTCSHETLGQRAYRVRALPVDILLGGRHRSKAISSGEFRAQNGIVAMISGFDVCGNCAMLGFEAHYFSKKTGNVWQGHNTGARFEGAISEKQVAVMPGDRITFRRFLYQCPGMKQPVFSDQELFFEIK